MAREVLDHGVVLPAEYSDSWYEDMTSNLQKLDQVIGSDGDKLSAADVANVAISGDYGDLTNKPSYGILRMTSETLSDSGSGAISNLNSDSKLAAGDYVLDAALKVFPIAAVSAPNYTVGTSLFQITNASALAAVATSGSYDDLNNLPAYGITRFVNAAISDNSNVAFANISSVDKIKAGDFLLDNAGKMYLIASVDSVNETAAVTTPLTQLAVDANVMHLSGNETASGKKTFTDEFTASRNTTNGAILLQNASYDPKTNGQSGVSTKSFAISFVTALSDTFGAFSCFGISERTMLRFTARYFVDSQTVTEDSVEYNLYGDGTRSFRPRNNNNCLLGETIRKWKDVETNQINGLTPSSLSLPENTYIDISGYITDFSGGSNLYRAPDNGIVAVDISGTDRYVLFNNDLSIGDRITGTNIRRAAIIQVRKNDTVIIQSNGGTLIHAKFYPCQGNV